MLVCCLQFGDLIQISKRMSIIVTGSKHAHRHPVTFQGKEWGGMGKRRAKRKDRVEEGQEKRDIERENKGRQEGKEGRTGKGGDGRGYRVGR